MGDSCFSLGNSRMLKPLQGYISNNGAGDRMEISGSFCTRNSAKKSGGLAKIQGPESAWQVRASHHKRMNRSYVPVFPTVFCIPDPGSLFS